MAGRGKARPWVELSRGRGGHKWIANRCSRDAVVPRAVDRAGAGFYLADAALPDRLMVRLRTLTPSIEVRILVGHPGFPQKVIDLRLQTVGYLSPMEFEKQAQVA